MTDFQFKHIALSVGDLDRQRDFYASALGFAEELARIEIPEMQTRLLILRNPAGVEIELVEYAESIASPRVGLSEVARRQGYFSWALTVSDLERAFEMVVAAGAIAVSTPRDAGRPGVRFAYVQDPEGNFIELLQFCGAESGN
ncbi:MULTISPECIES: VOC family protein [Burkholderia]|uniref:VOC family protein n=1 Tax=Burkholderia anthina TaxID=179879 RepID=A0ABS2B165_9BURK|nr:MULTISPECIES: VOC family protein [Burkholderia]AXK65169.1 VOC family protein [Burkholderia sp. IDO3]MBM2766722.1 VOC family protein [Burkholderia anthina]PCD61733.1 glyoxalase [Burkholderia sp. IDO3]